MRLRLNYAAFAAFAGCAMIAASAFAKPLPEPIAVATPSVSPSPSHSPTQSPSASPSTSPTPSASPYSPSPAPSLSPMPAPSLSPSPQLSLSPAPSPQALMLHRATPIPVPIPNVVGVSLAWPNGRSSIVVPVGVLVPHPIALVHVDGPGRVLVQWRLDGAAFHTEFGKSKKAGDIRFELSQPLPRSGAHEINLVILQPVIAPLASPSPAPALRYSIGG